MFDGAAYDPVTDTWRMIAQGPVPSGGVPTQVIPQGVWTGSELVVWGGWGTPIASAYDPVTDRWRDLPPGPLDGRDEQAVVLWGDRVVVLGGRDHIGELEVQHRLDGAMLDPATGAWTMLPELPPGDPLMAPGLLTAREAGGRLVVVRLVEPEAFVLEPGGTEWERLGPMADAQFLWPVGVADDLWVFVGGAAEQPAVAAVLDLASGSWRRIGDLPIAGAVGYVGAGVPGAVLVVPLRFSQDETPPSALAWEPSTDTWRELSPPPLDHRWGPATGWTGSELLVWGGASATGFGGPGLGDGAAFRP